MKVHIALSALTLLVVGVYGNAAWWKSMSLYQVYPRSFKDSDGDGIGDLKGIESKLQHFVDSKIDAFWLNPIYPSPMVDFGYDISDFVGIDPVYGTMKDFENLIEAAHNLSIKVILDFVPNHSADTHEWFQKSIKNIEPYNDYYVWHEGKIENGVRKPPNNWLNIFKGSGWTWNDQRQAFYFHQFTLEQPDFNFYNQHVVDEMKNILRFWMDKGVDGFRVDAIPHLFEDEDLRDEPLSGDTNDPNDYAYLIHKHTKSINQTYGMVRQWRDFIDEYEKTTGRQCVIICEAYDSLELTMKYYESGAHFPFNFGLLNSLDDHSSAADFKRVIDEWMVNLPKSGTSNWVGGNHDKSRLATRYGVDFAAAVMTMVQLLPGVGVTYYGDEIGMEDTWLTWEETQDPQGCSAGENAYEGASRDPVRTPFQWDNTTSAGFSTNPKTWLRVNNNYKTVNLATEKAANESYYNSFLKITSLRKLPAVKEGSLQTKLLNDNVFAFSRDLEGEKSVYVLINVSHEAQTIGLKAFENITSSVQLYHSTSSQTATVSLEVETSLKIAIPARSASIYISNIN